MKKILLKTIVLLMLGFLFVIYMKKDGLYMINKMFSTQLEMINQYASPPDSEFPDTTIVEEYEIHNDIESYFFSHNQCINAVLLVPNDEVDNIIPEYARFYDLSYCHDLRKDKNDGEIQYNVFMPRTVVKWISKTQRSIYYTVLKPGEKYTKIYIFVDKLGWNLFEVKK